MKSITGIILAGGKGRRMGGADKGLKLLRGKPLVAWVLERLAPQVNEMLINANQNIDAYAGFGYRVIPDKTGEADETGGGFEKFAGPLAGLQRGLKEAAHPLVITVPCDSPFLPADLVWRLYAALDRENAQLAVAKTFDQPHPVFCLCRQDVLPHLSAFMETGGRKIDAWYATLKVVEVNFDDEAEAFGNINTLEELLASEKKR